MPASICRFLTTALATALVAAPGVGRAQPPATTIADCASIAADSERLACYDRASGRAQTAVPAEATPAQATTPAVATTAVATAAPPAYGHPQSGVFPQPAAPVAGATGARRPE
jgi:hypothetical protein